MHQRQREAAEEQAQYAERTGDEYKKLMAEGARYMSEKEEA